MNYPELHHAVMEALQRRDYATCYPLLDEFIATAAGEQLGKALTMKSAVISLVDVKRAAEGLTLVDDALRHLADNPGESLLVLINGLNLCYTLGDIERVRKYEALGLRLLHEHPNEPVIRDNQFRLHLNLGLLALARNDHATAYWHFVQGASSLLALPDAGPEIASWLFWLHLHTATTCLHMGRTPEAEEALGKAAAFATEQREQARLTIAKTELLRRSYRFDEARALLEELRENPSDPWDAETRAMTHMTRALVARDQGDLRVFHKHLALAQFEAADGHLDYLLSDIQRIQRTPMEPHRMEGT